MTGTAAPPPSPSTHPTGWWHRVHRWPRRVRWPLKCLLFLLAVLLVLYPKVWLLPTWIQRLRDMNSVLDPQNPGLAAMADEVLAGIGPDTRPQRVLDEVQKVVSREVPYAFDWDTWGVVDYLPTVSETLALGREDCDGRAVVAASLLRRLGYQAWLASDIRHTWVATPKGDTMSPGGRKTITSDQKGTRLMVTLADVANLGRGVSYGVSVFPLIRELILCAVFVALSLHPGISRRRGLIGTTLLLAAVVALRWGGLATDPQQPVSPWTWAGLASVCAGWLILVLRLRRRTV